MNPSALSPIPLSLSRRLSTSQGLRSPNHDVAEPDADDTMIPSIAKLTGLDMTLDGASWNIDYPLETLPSIVTTNGDMFSLPTLPNGPANEITTPPSTSPTHPLIGIHGTEQAGLSVAEALALPASQPLGAFTAVTQTSSSWVNSATEGAIMSSNA